MNPSRNDKVQLFTKDSPAQWFQITLPKNVKVTHYSFFHSHGNTAHRPQNWQFQARKKENEGIEFKFDVIHVEWVVLDNHVNDQTIQKKFVRYTFAVITQEVYCMFRIYQTGKNSFNEGNQFNYLLISRFSRSSWI